MKIAKTFKSMEYGPAIVDTAAAERWLDSHGRSFGHFIGGRWTTTVEEPIEALNAATGKPLARIARGNAADLTSAVQAATQALPAWQILSGQARARYLYRLARLIQQHSQVLSILESLESGNPIRESRDIDIPRVARYFEQHASTAQLLATEFRGYRPVGVVGQIIPRKFPLLILARKLAPALAAGNTVIIKPAEFTSLTALRFADICQEAGIPAGVVNLVTGGAGTGELLARDPGIDALSFTGSAAVGSQIRGIIAGSGKRCSIEIGAKSAFVIFAAADIDSAIEGVVDAICRNQGKFRTGSRILAQEGVADHLTERLRSRLVELRIGDPLDKTVDIGGNIAPSQLDTIRDFLRITTFRTPAEAVELANSTPARVAVSLWAEEIGTALDIAPRLRASTITINCIHTSDVVAGFGGFLGSGFGGAGGREAVWEFLRPEGEEQATLAAAPDTPGTATKTVAEPSTGGDSPRLFIDGKERRPASGERLPVQDAKGHHAGYIGLGNGKDIQLALAAARGASDWTYRTARSRGLILRNIAENLEVRADEFASRITTLFGTTHKAALHKVKLSTERLFTYAAWAENWAGAVHGSRCQDLTLTIPEPLGTIGIICPEAPPLLSFISTVAPALAVGNRIVAVPCERTALLVTDLYQVLDASDLPRGVINIVTGRPDELAEQLAAHNDLDGIWYFGSRVGSAAVERLSAGNMKRCWVSNGRPRNWTDNSRDQSPEFLRQATKIKNIWIPYGI